MTFATASPTVVPPAAELDRLASLLNDAKLVTILDGAGCAGAHDELKRVAGFIEGAGSVNVYCRHHRMHLVPFGLTLVCHQPIEPMNASA